MKFQYLALLTFVSVVVATPSPLMGGQESKSNLDPNGVAGLPLVGDLPLVDQLKGALPVKRSPLLDGMDGLPLVSDLKSSLPMKREPLMDGLNDLPLAGDLKSSLPLKRRPLMSGNHKLPLLGSLSGGEGKSNAGGIPFLSSRDEAAQKDQKKVNSKDTKASNVRKYGYGWGSGSGRSNNEYGNENGYGYGDDNDWGNGDDWDDDEDWNDDSCSFRAFRAGACRYRNGRCTRRSYVRGFCTVRRNSWNY